MAESGCFFLSRGVSLPLLFCLIEEAFAAEKPQLADRFFAALRKDW